MFTVSLSGPQSQTVTVNYATADGTATAASGDYTAQERHAYVRARRNQETDHRRRQRRLDPAKPTRNSPSCFRRPPISPWAPRRASARFKTTTSPTSIARCSSPSGGGSAAPGVAEPGVQASTTTSPTSSLVNGEHAANRGRRQRDALVRLRELERRRARGRRGLGDAVAVGLSGADRPAGVSAECAPIDPSNESTTVDSAGQVGA